MVDFKKIRPTWLSPFTDKENIDRANQFISNIKLSTMPQTLNEQARELVEKFLPFAKFGNPPNPNNFYNAKQCALICNQRELDLLKKMADYWDIKNGTWYEGELSLLKQLRKEIENL